MNPSTQQGSALILSLIVVTAVAILSVYWSREFRGGFRRS